MLVTEDGHLSLRAITATLVQVRTRLKADVHVRVYGLLTCHFVSVKDGVTPHLEDDLTSCHGSLLCRKLNDRLPFVVLEVGHVRLEEEFQTLSALFVDCPVCMRV